MKRLVKLSFALVMLLLMASCNDDSIYSGFKKMENGTYMKFHVKGASEVSPRINDVAVVELSQYFGDTLLYTTIGEEPATIMVQEATFMGDEFDALQIMHVGDSVTIVVLSDSVFLKQLGFEEVPAGYSGKPFYYDMKLLEVKTAEVLEAERKALLDSLKMAEEAILEPFQSDPNNTVMESGLIILGKPGKGKVAKMGDYVDFDFMMADPENDTIINSFGIEPMVLQVGEEFMGAGFTEALSLVPAGGTMHFVIPSALAFDSTGFDPYILPYTPLTVKLTMNQVMDKAQYEKKLELQRAEKEAAKERAKAMEPQLIEEYLKANGITETPTESGLYILRVKEGSGKLAQNGDEVLVHYVLKTLKGEVLDSSYDYDDPMLLKVGEDEVFAAFDEALLTMSTGSKVSMIVPSSLAFGEEDFGEELPPYSPMLMELELVEIR